MPIGILLTFPESSKSFAVRCNQPYIIQYPCSHLLTSLDEASCPGAGSVFPLSLSLFAAVSGFRTKTLKRAARALTVPGGDCATLVVSWCAVLLHANLCGYHSRPRIWSSPHSDAWKRSGRAPLMPGLAGASRRSRGRCMLTAS